MGVELPLRVVVTILECCVTFSGVKLSIRSFVLFLLAISVDESNEEFFKRLEHSLSQLVSDALPSTKPEDFKLIKESKNYRNIYCKIYTHCSGTPKCLYSELVSGKHRVKPLEDAAFEKFKGSCIVRIFMHSLVKPRVSPFALMR